MEIPLNTIGNFDKQETDKLIIKLEDNIKAEQHLLNNVTYECGALGLSLFYCYYSLYTKNDSYNIVAAKYLNKAISLLKLNEHKRIYSSDSLDNHLANLGRFLCFAEGNNLFSLEKSNHLKQIDSILENLMESKIRFGDFDYNSGATASGYYFLSRLQSNPDVTSHLSKFVKGIEEKAQRDDDDNFYWPNPSLYNNTHLGLSHGSAMIISILASLATKNIELDSCVRIMSKATNFIIKHYRDQQYSHFPTTTLDKDMHDKPFCICYGDIGVAYALFKANKFLCRNDIQAIVDQIFEESLHRKRSAIFPPDASIIYGAAGLAALFAELSHMTSDARFQAASAHWQNEINGYSIYDNEFSGFQSMTSNSHDFWNASFGWGIIGIGISLMKHVDPSLPSFASLLMIA